MIGHSDPDERNAERQFDRMVFFSDAVFAIAITLLVLDLKVPGGRLDATTWKDLWPKLLGLIISFAVIGEYWLAHHQLFGTLHREDWTLKRVNLVFLATIIFLPFPTSVIAEAKMATGPLLLYALSASAAGFMLTLLTLVARRPGLMRPDQTRGQTVRLVANSLAAPSVFLMSVASVLMIQPRLASLLWILIIPARRIAELVGAYLERRIDHPRRTPPK